MTTNFLKNKAKAQRKYSLCFCALIVLLGLGLLPIPAIAQSNDLINRLKRIENEVDTLNRAVYKGEKRPAISQESIDSAATIEQRLSQIENDIRNLTGKFEQQSYDTQQLQKQLEILTQDSRLRLDALEKQARESAASLAPQPPQSMVDTNTVPPASLQDADQNIPKILQPDPAIPTGNYADAIDAASLYEKGFGEIKSNDFDGAQKSFEEFVKNYSSHALAPNALYWLGETYYVRKDYDRAARTFAEAYQKYPNGPKGADNLLKLGMSLAAKGEKDNACIALNQLKKEYPTGPEPVLKRGVDEMATLGCR